MSSKVARGGVHTGAVAGQVVSSSELTAARIGHSTGLRYCSTVRSHVNGVRLSLFMSMCRAKVHVPLTSHCSCTFDVEVSEGAHVMRCCKVMMTLEYVKGNDGSCCSHRHDVAWTLNLWFRGSC